MNLSLFKQTIKTPNRIPIHGTIAANFEPVKAAFIRNFTQYNEVGAACCIYHKGEKVVDLWGGYRDAAMQHQWEEDTMVGVFSTTKGISALCLAMLHSRGLLDYDQTVAHYWHEFAQNGKQHITVRQLMAHQAGLALVKEPLRAKLIADKPKLAQYLAAQKPAWYPGTLQGYHAWTIGWYISELIHRIDPKKRYLNHFLQEEICQPLGIEFHIGLHDAVAPNKVADLIPINTADIFGKDVVMPVRFWASFLNKTSMPRQSMVGLRMITRDRQYLNSPKFRQLELGAGNGIGSARAVAAIYNEFVTGGKILGINPQTINELEHHPHYTTALKFDQVLKIEAHFSLGLAKPSKDLRFSPCPEAYGTFGAGGSGGFADPCNQIALGYTLNRMGASLTLDPRLKYILDALKECI
ncbi:MAG: beta-lactamase family protein [Sphingobacteriales bacterium]|nr:beta-lactamase family protein [Sphingobacteriales bacterium]